MKIHFLLLFVFSTIFLACQKEEGIDWNSCTEKKGLIQQQGVSNYQYGTHTFVNDELSYALKSNQVDLNQYVGKQVIVCGEVIHHGISGGPIYYEVTQVVE